MKPCSCGSPVENGGTQCSRCAALQVLGLDAHATEQEIVSAYRLLAKLWRREKYQDGNPLKDVAEEKRRAIEAAYYTLHSVSYDRSREQSDILSIAPNRRAYTEDDDNSSDTEPYMIDEGPDIKQRIKRIGFYVFKNLLKIGVVLFAIMVTVNFLEMGGWQKVQREVHKLVRGYYPAEPKDNAASSEATLKPQKFSRQPSKTQPPKVVLKPYLTVGLTKEEVLASQGDPTSDTGDTLVYDGSELYFRDDKLVGWKIDPVSSAVRVTLRPNGPVETNLEYIAIGSTKDEVLRIQGTPNVLTADKFCYGGAEVYFKNNRVTGWKNDPASPPLRTLVH